MVEAPADEGQDEEEAIEEENQSDGRGEDQGDGDDQAQEAEAANTKPASGEEEEERDDEEDEAKAKLRSPRTTARAAKRRASLEKNRRRRRGDGAGRSQAAQGVWKTTAHRKRLRCCGHERRDGAAAKHLAACGAFRNRKAREHEVVVDLLHMDEEKGDESDSEQQQALGVAMAEAGAEGVVKHV